MKKQLIIFSVVLLLVSISFVSAGFWDWLNGRAIVETDKCESGLGTENADKTITCLNEAPASGKGVTSTKVSKGKIFDLGNLQNKGQFSLQSGSALKFLDGTKLISNSACKISIVPGTNDAQAKKFSGSTMLTGQEKTTTN